MVFIIYSTEYPVSIVSIGPYSRNTLSLAFLKKNKQDMNARSTGKHFKFKEMARSCWGSIPFLFDLERIFSHDNVYLELSHIFWADSTTLI